MAQWRVRLSVLVLAVLTIAPNGARAGQDTVARVLEAGRPLEIALDQRIVIKRVGQPVTGTVVDPVYAYDQLVVPAGTKARGHVQQLIEPRRSARLRAVLAGDFSPHRQIVLMFDRLVFDDGREMPIQTLVTGGLAHATRPAVAAAAEAKDTGNIARAKGEIAQRTRDAVTEARQKARDTLSAITRPGKMARLKDMAIQRLPYHRQFLSQGTVYAAELTSPVGFGARIPSMAAAAGTAPLPQTILNARLTTPLHSTKTPRGSLVTAVVTEPVFSADHQLILPEGTTLTGEVTFATRPRWLHRNGQLRFLFEQVHPPEGEAAPLLASLYSVQTSADDHVSLDDEGGASVTNSKTRFITPALAILALRGAVGRGRHADDDGDANDVPGAPTVQSGNFGSRGVGGFLGFGLLGLALGQVSRPLGIAFAVVGVGRTMYSNILGKGQDVSFPVNTPIELQLAPGPPRGQ